MYGMIHKAARAYGTEKLGDAGWAAFVATQGLDDAHFVVSQDYGDETTFGLIVALAELLDMPLDDFLRDFGHFWIAYSGRGAYANLMPLGGVTLPGFIRNLNRMHAGLALAMPGARMPRFEIVADQEDGFAVSYASTRSGLEPFVMGLLEGLCTWFGVAAAVSQRPAPEARTFDVRYTAQEAA